MPPAISIVSVENLPGALVSVLVRLPDGVRRRLVVPADLASVGNVVFSAAALAALVSMEGNRAKG